MNTRWWHWAGFILIWVTATILWTLAAAAGAERSPVEALPLGATQMGVAGLLALAIWRLSAAVPWRPRSRAFLLIHLGAIAVFITAYTAAPGLVLAHGRPLLGAIGAALTSPVAGWNLLIGSFLYLAIAGVSYARRAEASLREGERARAEARVSARDAQLAALNAQLHPHFLFNALHTVGALVHSDPDRADRALEDLGQLLRYALREPSDDVTLRQEYEFARDYLAFESLRLGPRLRLDLDVDDPALSAQVPPFVLQPLVENAVRHGAAASPEGGAVTLRIARVDHRVCIVVRNSVPAGGAAAAGMAGSGLRRLRERLELKYGPGRAGVETTAAEGDFTVTMTVPAEMEGVD
jgi:hypothetical protein